MGSLEKDLLKRMEGYRYGRFNLINNNFKFKYDSKGNIEIKDFYKGDKFGEGDCVKLTNDFCINNLDLNLFRIEGKEPTYFNSEGANHLYTLLPTKEMPEEFWKLTVKEKKEVMKNSNAYIVDPSFHLVLPFNDSGYEIKKFFRKEIENTISCVFEKGEYHGAPLGLNRENKLVSIGMKKNKPIINFQKSFDTWYHDYINLGETSRIRGSLLFEDDLQSICVNLSKKYVEFKEIKKPILNPKLLYAKGL